jgi:hypothetical protein
MILPNAPVIHRMQSFVSEWESQSDQRSIFLSCYMLMTGNMLTAVDQKEFSDPQWVDGLLHAFADYYFIALDTYNLHPTSAPPVWKLAHDACRDPSMSPLQKLLLGVNAHINYDSGPDSSRSPATRMAQLTRGTPQSSLPGSLPGE